MKRKRKANAVGPLVKPLFIPLRACYYMQFENGTKKIEFRKYGPRWNERVCTVGRPVVLSSGYGKRFRLNGTIVSFEKTAAAKSTGRISLEFIIGPVDFIAEIGIKIENV